MNRRQFLITAGVASWAVLQPTSSTNAGTKWWRYDGFTDSEAELLGNAIGILSDRICSSDVVANMYAIAQRSWTVDAYDTAIGLPATEDWNWNCAQYQMLYYLGNRVPHFHIRPYHEESDYWARAGWGDLVSLGCVITHDITNKTGIVKGEFLIEVNRYWLDAGGDASDPENWAGLLAHEAMHNLGHRHGKDEYGNHLQINAIMAAVRYAGAYRSGLYCPPWRCGRRS